MIKTYFFQDNGGGDLPIDDSWQTMLSYTAPYTGLYYVTAHVCFKWLYTGSEEPNMLSRITCNASTKAEASTQVIYLPYTGYYPYYSAPLAVSFEATAGQSIALDVYSPNYTGGDQHECIGSDTYWTIRYYGDYTTF